MQQRGDLMQLVIGLFQSDDPATRARIAKDIAAQAQAAVKVPPASEKPLPKPRERDLALLENRVSPVTTMTDAELDALNALLPWGALTADAAGRVVGSSWSDHKRSNVQPLIDERIVEFDRVLPLAGRHLLEVGCFEGIHTIGALTRGARVTGVDSRMENILKTLARLWAYGMSADVRVWDLELGDPPATVPQRWDVLHHIGVLYHLSNPAEHLAIALDRTGAGVLLDTHVATDEADASESYEALGRTFRYARKDERPISPFAGMRDHAKWLLIEDLEAICRDRGFTDVRVRNVRDERNGKRVLIWAFKPGKARPDRV